jgi:hypothetical protein
MPAVVLFFSENQTQLTFAAAFPGGYFFACSNLKARRGCHPERSEGSAFLPYP